MKLTICGSIAFYDQMQEIKKKLEEKGHEVKLPPVEVKDETGKMIPVKEYYQKRKTETNNNSWVWRRMSEAMKNHFDKVEWSDAILVLNHTKNNIPNYIGANTLIEMGLAFYLHKKIFLLKDIPEIAYKEEILATRPTIINENLNKIN